MAKILFYILYGIFTLINIIKKFFNFFELFLFISQEKDFHVLEFPLSSLSLSLFNPLLSYKKSLYDDNDDNDYDNDFVDNVHPPFQLKKADTTERILSKITRQKI